MTGRVITVQGLVLVGMRFVSEVKRVDMTWHSFGDQSREHAFAYHNTSQPPGDPSTFAPTPESQAKVTNCHHATTPVMLPC